VATFGIVADVGIALREVLLRRFHDDLDDAWPLLGGDNGQSESDRISLAPPEIEQGVERVPLSIWLYLVAENEYTKNRQPFLAADGTITPPPLALTLYYLVTPGAPLTSANDRAGAQERKQRILGKVLQVFHTEPIIALVDHGQESNKQVDELYITLAKLSLEEISQIWQALDEPFRISVALRVTTARVESLRKTSAKLILERVFEHGKLRFVPSNALDRSAA
jgi:hypothetical protein